MASTSSLLYEEQLQCSICLDVFTDPVSTPCGHNFCKTCLNEFWDTSSHYKCPMCTLDFPKRPELRVNTFISELSAQFKMSVQFKSSSGADRPSNQEPKGVLCDSCNKEKLEALKSCLDCGVSLCLTHLLPHKTAAKLKKHKLIDPVENLEDYICQKHEKTLELFCRDDQMCVCQFCILGDHKNHNTVPMEEESQEKKSHLVETQKHVQKMIQSRQEKLEELKQSIELNRRHANMERTESMKMFSALMRCIEKSQTDLLQVMEEKQNANERQAQQFIQELEQEIAELQKKNDEMLQLLRTQDHLKFLQVYPFLHGPLHNNYWNIVQNNSQLSIKTLRRVLHELQESLNKEILKLPEIVELTLDPDTANSKLILSNNLKQVRYSNKGQNAPDNPERFKRCVNVLAKEGFSSARFYYDVQLIDVSPGRVMASPSSVLYEDQLLCSICLDVFTDPVSTPCGHNFCMLCLGKCWDTSLYCNCPICKADFPRRPELCVNTFISELAAQFKKSIQVKSSHDAHPLFSLDTKVLCDSCTEQKLDAIKSCLHCGVSLCSTHLLFHKTTVKFKNHKLIDAVENLEEYICQKHERPLELFCRDDQRYVLSFQQRQLGERQAEVQRMIQNRLKKIEEVTKSLKLTKMNTEKEKAESMKVLNALIRCVEKSQAELLKMMEEKQKAAERQAENFIKELEQEISELRKRNNEMEKLSNTDDHLHLLQIYPSLRSLSHTQDWTDITITSQLSVETLRTQLQESLSKEMEKFPEIMAVTLDPNTANFYLMLSGDERQVTCGLWRYKLPDNTERFNYCACVLGKEGFSSGRFYYEVEVRGKTEWDLGVARKSVNRKGKITLTPGNGYWCVLLRNTTEYKASSSPLVPLFLKQAVQKVGVFVDYEKGLVSFYDVETKFHIYSFTVDVTLNADTAHPELILSHDGKQVRHGDLRQNLLHKPERFDYCVCVLGKEGFSSGKFYYEVQVKEKTKWDLGLAQESVIRKQRLITSPKYGFWTVWLRNKTKYEACDSPPVPLTLKQAPQKLGVFLDYEEGLISFYDVDAKSLIYSFTGQNFTEKLYPFFSPSRNYGGKNSAPLIITPVKQST
ncbi:E3 ubiquitin-protein ligase TRIM39 [Silurus asotus]|uniref:E3 ubiquitin-protein ligase TRIM39 n=1 Tax=Silurus asotus TaxID=30991 RepID=A0AAD5FHM6_SILAS|nr:E3 ubiquitin-protein ligase TRIM39 [Silurus asotus]